MPYTLIGLKSPSLSRQCELQTADLFSMANARIKALLQVKVLHQRE